MDWHQKKEEKRTAVLSCFVFSTTLTEKETKCYSAICWDINRRMFLRVMGWRKKVEAKKLRHDRWKVHKHVFCIFFYWKLVHLSLSLFSPFASLQQLPVITSNTIVRCRSCRTYINPFVTFLDQRRWKCNLCYRVNDGTSPVKLFIYCPCNFFTAESCFVALMFYAILILVQYQMSSCTIQSQGHTVNHTRGQRSRIPLWSSSPPQTTW